MRNAGAVIHSHGIESCLVTMLNPSAKEFRVSFGDFICFFEDNIDWYFLFPLTLLIFVSS